MKVGLLVLIGFIFSGVTISDWDVISCCCWFMGGGNRSTACEPSSNDEHCKFFNVMTPTDRITQCKQDHVSWYSTASCPNMGTWASKCDVQSGLRDKWVYISQNRKTFLRIRSNSMKFEQKHGEKIKYKCVENLGNIYLLRKRHYKRGKDGILCVGFSYLVDHPRAEYNIIRFNREGVTSALMSPSLVEPGQPLSVNRSCDLVHGGHREKYTFIKRRRSGCKFPRELRSSWNYTLYHSKKLIIGIKKLVILYLDGKNLSFSCDRRDSDSYVLRIPSYVPFYKDAIMCLRMKRLDNNPYYNYEVSRLNSGEEFDGQLRLVPRGMPVYLHQDCDWIDSPSRPEFIYP